ncbi:hypothetical protein EC988_001476 [Linderina pennispora]|nr:hypothetical protein EC988_001476 [Linderina pennispora]
MRHFRFGIYAKRGADFGEISKIPLVKYTSPLTEPAFPPISASSPPSLHGVQLNSQIAGSEIHEHSSHGPMRTQCPQASHSATSLHSLPVEQSHHRRYGFGRIHLMSSFSRLANRFSKNRRQRIEDMDMYKKQLSGPIPEFTPQNADDDMCAICLCEYENGDVLRLLPCGHHMHQSCVDEWLHINRTCPLCKRVATPDAEGEDAVATAEHSAQTDPEPAAGCTASPAQSPRLSPMASSTNPDFTAITVG